MAYSAPTFALLALVLAAPAPAASLEAGAARRVITPDLAAGPFYLAGFGQGRAATGVHDDLWVRCLALRAGSTAVVCAVDSIGLFLDDVERIRTQAAARLKSPAHIIVAATHVHEAPDTMGMWGAKYGVSGINDTYNARIVDRAVDAIVEAVSSLRPARARLARSAPADLDGYFDDSRPPHVLDPEVLALALDDARGARIATLVNWASHPESLGSRNTLITSDWPNSLRADLERRFGGLAVFVNGAVGGMMSPLGAKIQDPDTGKPAPPETFRFAEIVGLRVAAVAAEALASAKPAAIDGITFREAPLELPVANKNFLAAAQAGIYKGRKPMLDGARTRTVVGYLALTAKSRPLLEAALIPGELYPELSVGPIQRDPNADFPDAPAEPAVKRDLLSAPFRMLFGLANDENGYIIPKAEWDQRPPFTFGAAKPWYGEVNSVGPDTAPVLLDALRKLVPAPRTAKPGKIY
jgi:hypothetical protein